jgi:cytochrome c
MGVLRFAALTAVVAMAAAASCPAIAADKPAAVGRCTACHTFEPGGANKVGPALHGVFGKPMFAVAGYNYGEGAKEMAEAGGDAVWAEAALDAYLADPNAFLSEKLGRKARSKMTFKLPDAADRAAIIAYLKAN